MPCNVRPIIAALLVSAAAPQLRAQVPPNGPDAARRAAESIAEVTFRARAAVLAHDSMRGRDNPSPELDRAARWVAGEFERIGLRPGGDGGSFLQRYRVRRSRLDSAGAATVTAGGLTSRWVIGRDLALLGGSTPESTRVMPVVVLSGLPADPTRPFGDVVVRGAAVLHVVTPDLLAGPTLNQMAATGLAAGVGAWIVVVDLPAARWAGWVRRGLAAERWGLVGARGALDSDLPPVMAVRDSAAAALLAAVGADLASLHSPAGRGIRALEGARVTLDLPLRVLDEPTLPNVVGVLEGSDPRLRGEAVVFVAHADHVGVTAGGRCAAMGADSVCNGANDNASGTVGVIELAEAYASLRPRPARSMVFAVVSGEERGLFGSSWLASHPPVPLERTVAAITMDEIARNTPDTMIVVGKSFSSLGGSIDAVVGGHPEIGLPAVDDLWPEQNYFQRSDHYPFARLGVPALALYGGNSAEVHRPNDVVETADWAKAARVTRVAFFLGLEVANSPARPEWEPEARRRIVQSGS